MGLVERILYRLFHDQPDGDKWVIIYSLIFNVIIILIVLYATGHVAG